MRVRKEREEVNHPAEGKHSHNEGTEFDPKHLAIFSSGFALVDHLKHNALLSPSPCHQEVEVHGQKITPGCKGWLTQSRAEGMLYPPGLVPDTTPGSPFLPVTNLDLESQKSSGI